MTNPPKYQKNSHCSFCGQPFSAEKPWPRHCRHCRNITFQNPLPVAVLLLPVDDGVLTVRRTIEPRLGWLALPGGYIEVGESWQVAGARELWEEAGVRVDPAQVKVLTVHSGSHNTIIIVGQAPAMRRTDLAPFVANAEASQRVIVTEPTELAFPLHTQVVADYLSNPEIRLQQIHGLP